MKKTYEEKLIELEELEDKLETELSFEEWQQLMSEE